MDLCLLLSSSELSSNPGRSPFDLCPGRVTNSLLWLQKPNSLSFERECCPLLLWKAAWRRWKWRNLTTSWAPDKRHPRLASHYKYCGVHCRRHSSPRHNRPLPPQSVQPSYIQKSGEWTHWCLKSLDVYCDEAFRNKYGCLCYLALRNQRTHKPWSSLTFLPYTLDHTFHFQPVPPTQRSLQGPEEKPTKQSLKHHARPCHHQKQRLKISN